MTIRIDKLDEKIQEPDFVRSAYPGLILEASRFFEPGSAEDFPHGFFTVPILEFFEKMKVHNALAYEWLEGMWEPIARIVREDRSHTDLQLVFRADYCTRMDLQ